MGTPKIKIFSHNLNLVNSFDTKIYQDITNQDSNSIHLYQELNPSILQFLESKKEFTPVPISKRFFNGF